MVFNEIDNFIEVYNNSVIELIQCDQIPTRENLIPKHCICSITYKY